MQWLKKLFYTAYDKFEDFTGRMWPEDLNFEDLEFTNSWQFLTLTSLILGKLFKFLNLLFFLICKMKMAIFSMLFSSDYES